MHNNIAHVIGTPFKNRGRNIATGLDCWGLVMYVFGLYGVSLPDFDADAFQYRDNDKKVFESTHSDKWEVVQYNPDYDEPLVVLMKMHPKYIAHVGVYVGDGRILHTTEGTGAILSKITTLQRRIVGFYRYVDSN